MSAVVDRNSERLDALRREWHAAPDPEDREGAFSRLTDEWRAVEWQSGGKTLLAALGLQYQEVPLCRGLAWLLDPEGGHLLGRYLVDALLADLGLPGAADAPVTIRVEESREATRADIVVRVGEQTVVLEAKVWAGEQPDQADRLWAHWGDENSTFVFLTRTGHLPYTAKKSSDQWVARTWRDLAQLARRVIDDAGLAPSAGAREFIQTMGAL